MGRHARFAILGTLLILLVAFLAAVASVAADTPALAPEDAEFLEGLFKRGVPAPPEGGKYIRFTMRLWDVWCREGKADVGGWLTAADDGKSALVLLPWGGTLPAPQEYETVDFLSLAEQAALAKKPEAEATNDDTDEADDEAAETARMRRTFALAGIHSPYGRPVLAYAAWAYRLGDRALAARLLDVARDGGTNDDALRSFELDPTRTYLNAVHAYMVRADHEAMAHLRQYLNFAAQPDEDEEETKNESDEPVRALLDELQRRVKLGTFAKEPAALPDDLTSWPMEKRVAFLIGMLDEVDARQWGQPGGVTFIREPRVLGLIHCGDAAIPALIDCIEKDTRLTRSVHFWRDFDSTRTVLSVREPALCAAMSILRVQVFEPSSTGDNLTARGEEGAKEVAQKLRDYWKTYGGTPFAERMMKVLRDPASSPEATREAAVNIATLNFEPSVLGSTVWSSMMGRETGEPNPAIEQFNEPTAAEAIVAAMDRDLARHEEEGDRSLGLFEYDRDQIEDTYIWALVTLGDARIVDELKQRVEKAERVRTRFRLAYVCARLGAPEPLTSIARRFAAGKFDPGDDLNDLLRDFIAADTAPCNEALVSLAEPGHPFHDQAIAGVTGRYFPLDEGAFWLSHVFCLRLLRTALDDMEPTGRTTHVRRGQVIERGDGSESSGPLPDILRGKELRSGRVTIRRADDAAMRLNEIAWGLPLCHPLLKDSDERLAQMRAALDKYLPAMRKANGAEMRALGLPPPLSEGPFLPDMPPLGRAATADDVAKGRAVFHLDGKGTPADIVLPAVAFLRKDKEEYDRAVAAFEAKRKDEAGEDYGPDGVSPPPRVLIVQAEVGPDGKTYCGVITHWGVARMDADELAEITPLAEAADKAAEE